MASEASIRAMLDRRASHRSMFLRPPYLVACPRCKVDAGESCRTPDGDQRPAHMERLDVHDPQQQLAV